MKFNISSRVLEMCGENCTEGRCVNEQAETDILDFFMLHMHALLSAF